MISVLQRATVRNRVASRTVRRRAQKLLNALGKPEAELVIVLTDDTEIQELNRDFRSQDKPTDVLSFAQQEGELMVLPPGWIPALGDVIISIETAERQVSEGCLPRLWPSLGGEPAWDLLSEVTFLMTHGVLHLIGHDHMEPEEAAVMEALEADYLPSLLNRR